MPDRHGDATALRLFFAGNFQRVTEMSQFYNVGFKLKSTYVVSSIQSTAALQ